MPILKSMKLLKNYLKNIILIMLLSAAAQNLFSQTSGTLSFSTSTTSSGGYSPSHLLTIWIENANATFIKTKIKYSSPDNLDHLQTWVAKSGQNVVDAVTGPTLTTHGTVTFLWNGTDVNGVLVPDGSYNIWLEMAWGSSLSTGKTVNSFQFTKGATAFHSNPANTVNFMSTVVDWTPSVTVAESVLENRELKLYPNPTSGLLNIEFKSPHDKCHLYLINIIGKIVYTENLSEIHSGVRTFNFSGLTDGIYFCRLSFPNHEIVFRVIIDK